VIGRGQDILFDDEVRCGLAGSRNRPGREPADDGDRDHDRRDDPVVEIGQGIAAGDNAEQDRQEGARFDQVVAGRQFLGDGVVGQYSLFDLPCTISKSCVLYFTGKLG